ncbi:DUF6766 family protein [Pseudonocardia bannensis]|uniref:Uncharacterized protein n=1 Tax=Pseudonocardia bannensis TaxID=630973 RepID=A0A848DG26_9PSEU|nr:DUF6766 family protein [Pseudonocardia bannensis]NMH91509.1 hypothetical protein [Pseudonocardia bannensis]
MKRALRDNGLSLAFGLLFLAALVGQAFAGQADFNDRQLAQGAEQVTLIDYVTSSDFGVDVVENWQSEYLQFFLYIFGTVWLVQRGSPESKNLDEAGLESDRAQKVGRFAGPESPRWAATADWRTTVFSRSLGLLMGGIFLLSWAVMSVAGWAAYNAERLGQRQDAVSWLSYVGSADFWNRTLQNWQSELLAVGSMAIFAVFLRQRGSPESKPVGDPHTTTADTG